MRKQNVVLVIKEHFRCLITIPKRHRAAGILVKDKFMFAAMMRDVRGARVFSDDCVICCVFSGCVKCKHIFRRALLPPVFTWNGSFILEEQEENS
jgi:hypothetical protein